MSCGNGSSELETKSLIDVIRCTHIVFNQFRHIFEKITRQHDKSATFSYNYCPILNSRTVTLSLFMIYITLLNYPTHNDRIFYTIFVLLIIISTLVENKSNKNGLNINVNTNSIIY